MSRLRAFFRDVVTACQPRELVEAHHEIKRLNDILWAEKALRTAVTIRSMEAEAVIARVRAIPRLPHTSEQQGELGRAYTRGWQSVIDALDAALEQPEET